MRDFLTPLGLYSRPRQECRRPNPVSSAAGIAEPQSCTLAVTLAAQSCLPEPHSSPINQFRPENYPFSRTKHQKIDFPFGKTTHFPDKHSYFCRLPLTNSPLSNPLQDLLSQPSDSSRKQWYYSHPASVHK